MAEPRCPSCGAGYPTWHSPVGTLETACDNCGWRSDEDCEKDGACAYQSRTSDMCPPCRERWRAKVARAGNA